MAKQYQFTQEGFENLKKELQNLIVRRPQVVINLSSAREQGDLSENAGYHAAKDELSQIDSRIKEVKYLMRMGQIIKSDQVEKVKFGSSVTVSDGQSESTFQIVEVFEADPLKGKISTTSPIGIALLNKGIGETVQVSAPVGKIKYKIIKIQ